MKTIYKVGVAAAAGLALAAWPKGDPAPANHLPRSVASIERAGNVCPQYGLSTLDETGKRYAGHVVLMIPPCRGNSQSVELVSAGGDSDGVVVTGQELAVSRCEGSGELAVRAVITRSGPHHEDVTEFHGEPPRVVLGQAAVTQLTVDHALRGAVAGC